MDFTIAQADLTKALGQLQNIVERRSTMPILANCCIEANDQHLRLSATDLEVAMQLDVPATVKVPGKVTVGARNLFEIVKALPADTVRVTVAPNHWVEVVAKKSRFKIVGLSAEEFPAIPLPKLQDAQPIDAPVFLQMLAKTTYAMSTDETRYNLNGMQLEALAGETGTGALLRLVATDGHRLALVDRPLPKAWALPKGVLVPRKGVTEWRKVVEAGGGEPFALQITEKYLTVQVAHTTLLIRLIDGQFPPYRQVIPKEHTGVMMAPRSELLATLKRVQLVTTEKARGVKCKLSKNLLEIHANNPEIGEAHEELAVQYQGEPLELGFNARYLIDVLAVMTDDTVTLAVKGEMGACLLKSEQDPNFLAVVMPMRLS